MSKGPPETIPEPGDKVGWNWGGSHAEGHVQEVIPETASIESKGKEITRKGTEDNPAVVVENDKPGGNPVIKKASELHTFKEGEEIPKSEKVETGV